MKTDKNKTYWLAVYYLVFTTSFLLLALVYPRYNFDIIGYIAAAKSFEIPDKDSLHAFVYGELEKAVPEEPYAILVNAPFRKIVSEDPELLDHERPLYQIRIAYVGLVYLLHKAGVNIVAATYLVSALAVFFGLWLFFLALWEYVDNYLILSLPLFVLTLGLFEVARLSTPDGLAFLLGALVIFLLLKEKRAVLFVLPLAVLVRTDQVIFVLFLLAYLFISHKQWRIASLAAVLLTLLLYFGINHLFGNPDTAILYRLFGGKTIYPAEANITVGLADYWRVLVGSSLDILQFDAFLTYAIVSALSVLLYLRLRDKSMFDLGRPLAISLVAFLSVLAHYLLFPEMWSRFFSTQYLLGAAIFLMMLTAALNTTMDTKQKPPLNERLSD